jgi:hypothetical protein
MEAPMTTMNLDTALLTAPATSAATPAGSADGALARDDRRTRRRVWTGRVLSGIAVAFLTMDASLKVFGLIPENDASNALGFPRHHLFTLGVIQVVCLAVYLYPRTALVGAVLWTGYLGGAIATHLRVDNPLLSHTLFPIYVAALLWGGLWLRDLRTRALVAPTRFAS